MNTANDLVEEGLVYFERSGDEGDKEYVRAIRAHIAHLTTPPKVAVSDEDVLGALTRLFTSGYLKGHNDTVEGSYVDVFYADRPTYLRDDVTNFLDDSDYAALKDLSARLAQPVVALDRAAAEVLEQENLAAIGMEREKGIELARKGVQHLFVDDAYPPNTIPDDWSDKPFARIQWVQEDGDPSVGQRGWAGWTLAPDQKGTMVGALAEFCRTNPDNWERFNDLYNQTHEVP
jgi:hypothetical protein